jgi:hypothetical protein
MTRAVEGLRLPCRAFTDPGLHIPILHQAKPVLQRGIFRGGGKIPARCARDARLPGSPG